MSPELGPLARDLSVPYYEDALPAHDLYHAKRVHDLSIRLAGECEEPVDRDVLAAAAWLHDIGRPRERVGTVEQHGAWAATEAAELLAGDDVASEHIEAIQHCLRSHSIRASSPTPETIEAKLLFDADKLDAAGARGLLRLACIVGERSGRTGERYAVIDDATTFDADATASPDISLLREWTRERLDALYTAPGRRLGTVRWRFVETFLARFDEEIGVDGTK
ncbi:HD domain-containing protein [Halorarius litoreus]|uniref:HD domain-containing protein n=1 Tax=Halorarius litoreus TaxID=2962676 RepID=UPI0020CC47E8|nr:HD domain-containing protein [Halorarius litoreus]